MNLEEWCKRELDDVYVSTIIMKEQAYKRVNGVPKKQELYIFMGLNLRGYKKVIDVIVPNENTTSYWFNKISEFKARGIKELFMVAMLENENMNRAIKYYIKKLENDIPYMFQLYEYPIEIRKLIYTTNPIESLNSELRKVTNGKRYFVNEKTLEKVLCLRVEKYIKI